MSANSEAAGESEGAAVELQSRRDSGGFEWEEVAVPSLSDEDAAPPSREQQQLLPPKPAAVSQLS